MPRISLPPLVALFALCCVLPAADGLAQTASNQAGSADIAPFNETFSPNVKPLALVNPARGAITIDGVLDDEGWVGAETAYNFSETFPGDQTRPPIDIVALLTYDDQYLYVAYQISDEPGAIRANFSDRDLIWQDDYVGLLIDANRDGQETYLLAANPLGIQGDTRISQRGEDVGFDVVFRSEGRLTDDGYQVEMAIPFRSLRFPRSEVQQWGLNFWITHPRDSRRTYSWAAIDRDDPCWTCQFGTLEGLEGVRSGGNLEFLPSVTGAQSAALRDGGDPESGLNNDRVNAEPSLDVKYGITSDLTADLTLNPDFSQIEADVAQIDVNSTFALFFPERRPFFQEGSDLFQTPIQTVYTRSINDPIIANKVTGRFGSTNVAYIGARDNTSPLLVPFEEQSSLLSAGKSISNIVRVQHNFANSSYMGGLVTDRRLEEGGAGTTLGLDGVLRLFTKYRLEGQAVLSRTAEPDDAGLSEGLEDLTFDGGHHTAALDGERFWGHALTASFNRNARHWNFDVTASQTSPTFRADNGFVSQNNRRRLMSFQSYTFYPETLGFIDRISPRVYGGRVWNYDGLRKEDFAAVGLSSQMKGQTRVNLSYGIQRERFGDREFTGLREFELFANSNFSEPVQLGGSLEIGRDIARNLEEPEVGKSLELAAFGTLRPTQRLSLQPRFSYARLTDRDTGDAFFSGYIARMRLNYQFTRRFFLRTVVQYNDFAERLEVDPLVTYRINPFTAFYVGSTHRYDTYDGSDGVDRYLRQSSRQFFFKFQYLFRT